MGVNADMPAYAASAVPTSAAAAPAGPHAHDAAALHARSVSVSIGGARILTDVDLTVEAGRVHALIGPNGAGKSTLLAALAGDIRPAGGRVSVRGTDLDAWKPKQLARERAVLLQENRVSFPFTVDEVVRMGRSPWRGTPAEAEDEQAVAGAIAATELHPLLERPVPSLSGGERARAALARVLAQRAGILLLDEPTAALDLKHQEDVLRLARERARAGDAVVIVLHDLTVAAAFADTITLLENGRVVATGTPAEVLTAERIRAVYRQDVDLVPHPATGQPIIVPRR